MKPRCDPNRLSGNRELCNAGNLTEEAVMSTHKGALLGAVAAILAVVLVGCGGGLLETLLGLVSLGNAVGDVRDLFDEGDNAAEFRVLLDGQLLPVHPAANGDLTLTGLPEGQHLLQVVKPNRVVGSVTMVTVAAGTSMDVGSLEAVHGGRITGSVEAEAAGGGLLPARRVLVVAIPGGAAAVDATHTEAITVPPAATYYAAYTDGNGDFSLDALEPGDYLVTAALAGHKADVQLIQGLVAGQGVRNLALELAVDPDAAYGEIGGVVSGSVQGGTQSLSNALLKVRLAQGFRPKIPAPVRDRIAQESGTTLMTARWFAWKKLSTLTDAGGSYQWPCMPGNLRLDCFAYGYKSEYQDIVVTGGGTTFANFTLAPL